MAGRPKNLAELAAMAGVSTGTVSRALAGSSMISAATRDRITALAREHGLRPNQMASRLRTQRTGVIGVVIPLGHERRQHLSDPFFMTMLGQLADALTEAGYDIMLSRVIPDADDWLDRIVDSGMLDGVLLIGQSNQFATIERVAARYRPLVAWGALEAGQAHVAIGPDNVAGGRLAGAHLAARAVRQVAFLGEIGPPEFRQRFDGCAAALAAAGLPPPRLLPVHLAAEHQARDLKQHLAAIADGIDGLFAATDVIAMTALRVMADEGLAVPDRVRIIGYDDLPLAVQTVPRLTTVRQDIAAGARAMVDALFARMRGAEAASVQMPPRLVVRDSA